MNTVTKQLFLTFGLCVMLVGITHPGERKRAESASELLGLPRVESVESLGTVDPNDLGSIDPHNYSEEGLNDEAQLMVEVKRDAEGKLKNPGVMLGTDPFKQERFEGKKKVKFPREIQPNKKPSILQKCLGCCRRPAKQ